MSQQEKGMYADQQYIFRCLSEQLKLPFLQIRSLTETLQLTNSETSLKDIESISSASLRLIDAYLLAAQHEYGQQSLALEPVSTSATLANVAYMLNPYAKAHGLDIEVSIRGKYEPVMSHQKALEYALFCLAHSFIDGLDPTTERTSIVLGTHKSHSGISVGVYMKNQAAERVFSLANARKLMSRALQPVKEISSTSASGIFIADSLLATIGTDARLSRHLGHKGIGVMLPASKQMSLL